MNVNTSIYDKQIDRSAMLRLYEMNSHKKLEIVLNGHVVRVDSLIRKSKLSSKTFKQFQRNLDVELTKTYKKLFGVSKRSLLDLAADQTSYMYQSLEAALSKVWRVKNPARRISEDIVLHTPLHQNKTLEMGWKGIQANERKRIAQIIRKGIADGDTEAVIARNVRKGNVHKITRNQSRALTTTAMTSVHAQVDHAVYAANEKALKGWQYVAVLDGRTTQVCASRDGKVFAMDDRRYLPPAHYNCRSTTVPVVKSWDDLASLESVAQVRKRNLKKLSPRQRAFYDGQTPLKESYSAWLLRQPQKVQFRHLGDYQKVDLFNKGKLPLSKFVAPEGGTLGIRQLRKLTDTEYNHAGDTQRFAHAKEKLDAMQLGVISPDDFIDNRKLTNTLRDYYVLQSKELNGTLSLTNYRGNLIGTKRAQKRKVMTQLPREDQLIYNPVTGRYDDARLFPPSQAVLDNNLRLVRESLELKTADKEYIDKFINSLSGYMSVNERAVVTDNLRILFTRFRKNAEPWTNFKAVAQAQIKFDVMNVSDFVETTLRKDANLLKKLAQSNYIDPVLGPTTFDKLSATFISNIKERNKWEDRTAPKIARELRDVFDRHIPYHIRSRLDGDRLQQFYLKFAHRLSLADGPDVDQLSVALGRDLYNLANLNGTRLTWHRLGKKLLESNKTFFDLETLGVQKRRMKSRMSGQYFGPYYDTFSYNLRITDDRIRRYAELNRSIEVGLRIGVTEPKNRLYFREGYKTYFTKNRVGLYSDTRIPVTSTSSFSDFPEEFIDKELVTALNWTSSAKYKIDEDFYDFITGLMNFKDDRGAAKYFDDLNQYKKYIISRGDSYERFKAMDWFRNNKSAFSNHAFIDHRARIYDRGFIGPQSGETFRPFLNTAESKFFSEVDFKNLQDQVGAFLGGLDDYFEGRFNSLSVTGRQKIAEQWRPHLVKIGNHMMRGKPNDFRAVLKSDFVSKIEGEELGKFFRFAIEVAKIDNHLTGNYSKKALASLRQYRTALALEQDASSSGAQIIALTTRNKQLAELSNVIPTNQKQRLYDEIAASTFNDPRFRKLNQKFGLTEKDLRKAAKAQNMVTFYGAGERTGILNVEGKLAKVLDRKPGTLVVKAADRETVLSEISARIARYELVDKDIVAELKVLRANVRDIFNKGTDPGNDIIEQLYFLDPATKELVNRMTRSYVKVVTPQDFKEIAKIMSEYLSIQVPILKDFTKFLGRLAEDFLINAKPSKSAFDWKHLIKLKLYGSRERTEIDSKLAEILGIPVQGSFAQRVLQKFSWWKPNGTLHNMFYGTQAATKRRTGAKYLKVELLKLQKLYEVEVFEANKLPSKWTSIPWKNFDGKTIEQNFTQVFEERLRYRNKDGEWITNILQVPQKSEATWWEQIINDSGNINDIADATKARTAFAVNGNHSNDAVVVKRFHLWGQKNGVPTSTIHDAFFTNAADMLKARDGLRQIYAKALKSNTIKDTLDEMLARGLPRNLYDKYLNEAIESGLIPVVGRSRVGGRRLRDTDILTQEDILKDVRQLFEEDAYWYGVG